MYLCKINPYMIETEMDCTMWIKWRNGFVKQGYTVNIQYLLDIEKRRIAKWNTLIFSGGGGGGGGGGV